MMTIPLAQICHDPEYNQAVCNSLKEGWPYTQTQYTASPSFLLDVKADATRSASSPSCFVDPIAQNQSCDPFTSRTSICQRENEPVYAVNASAPDHIVVALKFARLKNFRVVVKSTGHDLLEKSSGLGSLSIWVHSLKDTSFTKTYSGANDFANYSGPAARLGSGVMVYEVLEASMKEGLKVLGGACPTVAVGGGYTSGGGPSILSSIMSFSGK
jgi:hypothetical protein